MKTPEPDRLLTQFTVLILGAFLCLAEPLGTAWNYQGRLVDNELPADGLFDLSFVLYDAAKSGNQLGLAQTNTFVRVSNGLFRVVLDFGAVFTGEASWLEIAVRTNGDGGFTTLSPRQELTPMPHALHASTSGNATTATTASAAPWSGITAMPPGFADGVDNDTVYSAGLGLNLIGTEFSVNFDGNGVFDSAARSDHHHDATYSLLGHGHAARDLTTGTLADERLSSNVALLNAHQTFSGSNLFSGVVQLTNTNNSFAGSFSGSGSGLTGLSPANLAAGTAGIDISGNAATATTAATAATAASATTATTAGSAATFTDPLAGDVTGNQQATVVASVGGLTAAEVASGANAANAGTDANTPDTIVMRDGAGHFAAGDITANSFSGGGSGLTALNASSLTTGTLADDRLSSNVALLDAHQTFSGANTFNGVLTATNLDNSFVGSFSGSGSGLAGLDPASFAPGTAAIDISGTAANATTATSAPWSGLTGVPPGFADNVDNDTLYTAGLGLNLTGTEFRVLFGGNGTADNAARSDHDHNSLYAALVHNHDGTYSPLGHHHVATEITSGTLSDERLSSNVPLLDAHQTFGGSNTFNGVVTATNLDNSFVGSFSGDGNALTGLNPAHLAAGMASIHISGNAATASSATTATTAGSAATFTEPLAGDVTGNQNNTVVASVGGQTAANVASGVTVANAATEANTANTLVKRDGSGNFTAGNITANSFAGDGAGLTSLNASQLGSGMIQDARLSGNVALLNAQQTFSGSNLFSGVVQLTNIDNSFVGTFAGNASSLTGLSPANLTTGTAHINISGQATSATTADSAASAGSAPWSGITGMPPGFADGVDNDTLYSAGLGLNLIGGEFGVIFGGNGVASSAAHSDHDHNGLYAALTHDHDDTYSLLGHEHAATDLTSGTLGDERLSSNVALLSAHQTFSGSNTFTGVNAFTNANNTFVGTLAGEGSGLSNLVVAAANVFGSLPAAQLSGVLPPNLLGGAYSNAVTFNNPANVFAGSGSELTGVDAAKLGGLTASDFWQLGGNAGTTAGINFLGTTDDQALELKVNGQRAYRLEPTAGAPNVIGGASGNQVFLGSVGTTISGGDGNLAGFDEPVSYVTVGGGAGNTIDNQSIFSTIGGGGQNNITSNSAFATISGGHQNQVLRGGMVYTTNSTIGGGYSNTIWVANSVINGGIENRIGNSASGFIETGHTISGGTRNIIGYEIFHSTISGGTNNFLDASYSTIAGGAGNRISWGGHTYGNSIGGGVGNHIVGYYSAIGGGQNNSSIYALYSVIPGGFSNSVTASYCFAAGQRAHAGHQGTFIWADSTDADFTSTGENQFLI
ncbi:MAG: hypothetical protein IH623_04470 [Verrucomicrobia bacterium]|nr:hypothetical protein [Verrucomicrobiota bacterium]